MKNRRFWIPVFSVLAGLSLLLVACGPQGTGDDPSLTPPGSSQVSIPGEAQKVVSLVQQEVADQRSISVEEVRVVEIEAVDWPDTSLGCPQEGMMYLQVITPGYRVVVAAEGQQYEYHTDMERIVLCEP